MRASKATERQPNLFDSAAVEESPVPANDLYPVTAIENSIDHRNQFRALKSAPPEPLASWCRFRITARQEGWLGGAAAEVGVNTSALARHLLFRSPLPRRTLPKINAATLAALNRVGNNLNQAVALVHARRQPVDLLPVLEQLMAVLVELRATVSGIERSS